MPCWTKVHVEKTRYSGLWKTPLSDVYKKMTHTQVSLLLLIVFEGSFAAIDNAGTEFILGYMNNYVTPGSDDYDLELFITTSSNYEAFINVTTPLYDPAWINQTSVTRGNIATVTVPAGVRGNATSKGVLGVYITATEEVTVYSVNKQLFSTDAFTGYPTDSLGSHYVAVTWENLANIMVVGVTDGTTVDIHFPSSFGHYVQYDGKYYAPDTTLTFVLNRFETFHILSWSGDLTGTRINATSNIAAFSGGYKVAVEDPGYTNDTSDHLVEQLMPTESLGKEFISFPSPERTVGDFLRVIAVEDNTTYTMDGSTYNLSAYEFDTHNINSDTYYYIQSNKGISVMLFSKSIGAPGFHDGPNGGDPAMSVVVPLPLYGYDYTWSTVHTTYGAFTSNFIIVVTRETDISGLVLDDEPISNDTMWTTVVGKDEYVGARFSVGDGSHSIYNTDPTSTFFGIAYGNALYNSYGYASGLRLTSINLPCTPTDTTAGDGEDNDCDGWIDEETNNGIDDDGDGQIDEDLASEPRVDGNWTAWSDWSSCSTTCGGTEGTYTRSRSCTDPAPANNGLYCSGNATETGSCYAPSDPCPSNNSSNSSTDGNWGAWGNWSSCSVSCGSGTQTRDRQCDDPAPQNGGLNCTGEGQESENCTMSDYCLPSFYGNLLLGCSNTSFGCATGTIKCIDLEFRCDGTVDCDDGTDESEYFTGCSGTICSGRGQGEMLRSSLLSTTVMVLVGLCAAFK